MEKLRLLFLMFFFAICLAAPSPSAAVIYVTEGTPGEALIVEQSDNYVKDANRMTIEFQKDLQENLKVSDIEKYTRPDFNAMKVLTPYQISGKIKNANPDTYVASGVIRPCLVNASAGKEENEKLDPGYFLTEPLPDSYARLRQSGKFFNLAVMQKGVKLTEKLFDFREEQITLSPDALPPCGVSSDGTDMDNTSIEITESNSFLAFVSFLRNKIQGIFERDAESAVFSISNWKKNSYDGALAKTISGKGSVAAGELTGDDAKMTGEAKGYVTALTPYRIALSGSHGRQENFGSGDTAIVTNDQNYEELQENKELHMCSYMPYNARDTYVPDDPNNPEKCVFPVGGGGSCNGKPMPELPKTDSSCGLCNMDEFGDFLSSVNSDYANQLDNGKLPQTAIDILNAAASQFRIPAPILLGAMIHEGAFIPTEYKWTDDNVTCWSVEGGRIGTTTSEDDSICRKYQHPATQSRGAFGWFSPHFDNAIKYVINGFMGIPGFPKFENDRSVHDPCNFYDAAMAAAAAMSSSQAGSTSLSSCQGYTPYNGNGGLASSCSDWSIKKGITAYLVFAGNTCSNNNVARVANAMKKFSCYSVSAN